MWPYLAAGLKHHELGLRAVETFASAVVDLRAGADFPKQTFLLKREGRETDPLLALLERGVLQVGLRLEDQLADLRALMRRYRDRPMSLADACLVRLAELHPGSVIFTFDSDFRIYRRHGSKVIPVLMPEA